MVEPNEITLYCRKLSQNITIFTDPVSFPTGRPKWKWVHKSITTSRNYFNLLSTIYNSWLCFETMFTCYKHDLLFPYLQNELSLLEKGNVPNISAARRGCMFMMPSGNNINRRILCLIKHCAMKTCWGNGGVAPHILKLNSRWRWGVSFTPQLRYPRERTYWIGGWVVPGASLGVVTWWKNPRFCRESNPAYAAVPTFLWSVDFNLRSKCLRF